MLAFFQKFWHVSLLWPILSCLLHNLDEARRLPSGLDPRSTRKLHVSRIRIEDDYVVDRHGNGGEAEVLLEEAGAGDVEIGEVPRSGYLYVPEGVGGDVIDREGVAIAGNYHEVGRMEFGPYTG